VGCGLLLWEPTLWAMDFFVGAHPVGDGLHGVCHAHRPQGWAPTKNFARDDTTQPEKKPAEAGLVTGRKSNQL
jgi:hypothetical protein